LLEGKVSFGEVGQSLEDMGAVASTVPAA